jgi:hypothetical protein
VKWNISDWWPARVVYAREDGKGIEVEYDDETATREEMKWPEDDVFVLDDVKQAVFITHMTGCYSILKFELREFILLSSSMVILCCCCCCCFTFSQYNKYILD